MKKLLAVGLYFGCSLSTLLADWHFDAKSGALYDSNLSRSDRSADKRDDWAWKTDLNIGFGSQLSRNLRFNLSGEIESQLWGQFQAFDKISAGMSAGLRYRFGLGPLAPWIMTEGRLHYEEFSEDRRNGWNQQFVLRAGKGLTDRLSVEADYVWGDFSANDLIFDQVAQSCSIHFTYDLTSSLQISLGYVYRYGDVISYAVPPRPDILGVASVLSPIESFGTPYVAYRFKASTQTVALLLNYRLSKFVAIQLGYERSYTSRSPLDYVNNLVETKIAISY